jgi:kynurenine formamidase
MPVYPGDPKGELKQIAAIDKDGFTDHELKTAMHVGTHMDAPLHMIDGAKKISDLSPDKFFGPGKLIDARGMEKIDVELLTQAKVATGDIVLILSGFGEKFQETEYFEKYPELTEEFANKLVKLKVKMIGTDTPSPDRSPFSVHKILLTQEILIMENLTNLEQLLNKNFEVIALPAKLETDAAPCRVIAKIS